MHYQYFLFPHVFMASTLSAVMCFPIVLWQVPNDLTYNWENRDCQCYIKCKSNKEHATIPTYRLCLIILQ